VGAGSAAPVGYDPSGRYLVLATGPEALDGVPRTVAVDAVTREALADVPRADALAWVAPGTLAHWGAHSGGLLDVASGRDRSAPLLDRHPDQVYAEPDGRNAWTSTAEPGRTVLRRFALSIGRQPGTRIEVPGYVQSLAVAPGGRTVLVTYADDVWRSATYDVATGRRLGTGMTGQVRAVVSSTGRLVAADPSGDVTEFGLRDLTPLASLPGSRGGPSSLQFDAAGRTLVVTTADQTVQVYDVATRARLGDALPSGARDGMVEGWLRPDGDAVAVNGPAGVLEWTIEPQAMARPACALAGRNLTPTEWSTYLGANRRYRRTCPDYPAGSS
jgi:hypothetical protein